MDYIIFIISMAALIKGADFIIKESEKIALHFDISEFVIGATLVALGTSLPEMAASIAASYNHKSDLAISNVIGSVIINITLVLGIVFLFAKKVVPKRDIFQKDSAWALFPLFMFLMVSFDGTISFVEGLFFLVLMGGYLLFLSQEPSLVAEEIDEDIVKEKFAWIPTLILLFVGFVMVVYGADFAVGSASRIARSLGVSEWLIGLFLIAFGTSLPELVVSIVAAMNDKADMSIGNIIGSNVANFSVVLGSAALVNPLHIDIHTYAFDILTAIIASVMLIFITASKLYNKSAGIVLLATLGVFIVAHLP
ncbi:MULTISPECIES: calcium/sodium antiporter [unclassified Nitratiruptor]|uniref:calcium/sodium antiporter n=1 Tax=unclassified Nitratiruptor TaxID=2624044 RepID=UPI00191599EB|nr:MULTISPECIES: calcium/sodium antiporter [unclassified Nitratiruptor]BCD60494.1 cation:H+ antiporter [Nitratiruptor sp. YY08-10]BCD64017.1 cation:H+ antiporter [Nitratiruptor sp. YY08-14]